MNNRHLLAVLLCFLTPASWAQDTVCAAPEQALAAERAIAQAQVSNDLEAIDKLLAPGSWLLAPGYTFTISDGKIISRERFLKDMRDWWRPLKVENSEQQVRCAGGAVLILGKALYEWKGKDGVETAKEQYTDTYVNLGGVWRRASSHSSCLSGRCT